MLQAKLHFVLGHTVVNANGVDVCQQSQSFAYIAGPCVVIRSLTSGREHVIESSDVPLTCVSLSSCGRFLATGESGSACVRVHDAQPSTSNDYSPLVLTQHSHGVAIVKFIPHTPLLVSVGVQQDAQICLWNWQTGKLVESAKLAANVRCVALSDDNTVLVTAGEKHLKFWNLSHDGFAQSRSAILANQRSSTFTGCVFLEPNRVLAVTEDGHLVEFVNKKYVNAYQWNDVEPTCLTVADEALILGCSSGTVALHSRSDLSPLSSLPLPVPTRTDPASVSTVDALQRSSLGATLSPVVSVTSTPDGHVVSVHADRSIYVHSPLGRDWRRLHSDVSHNGPITTLIACPQTQSMFPEGSFISGGVDGTVRIWNRSHPSHSDMGPFPQTNLLSPFLKKTLFLEEDRTNVEALNVEVSSLSMSSDGHHLAVGTRAGNIHIFDATLSLALLQVIPAHDGDVLAVSYSDMNRDGITELFASGGRDGLIHIFKPATPSYGHVGVVEEHKFALKTLAFAKCPTGDYSLFSGAADGTLLIHRISFINQEQMEIYRLRQLCLTSAATCIMSNMQAVLIAAEDGSVRYLTVEGDDLAFAEGTKDQNKPERATSVCIDSSGTLLALCDTEKTVLVRSRSGRVISHFPVGATVSTFSTDGRKLLVASENGCVYSWKLAKTLQASIAEDRSLLEQQLRRSPSADSLLGSGSEGFVDEATASTSVLATEWDSDESERTQPEIVLRTEASRSALTVRPAQVTRRSNSNLLAALEADHHDFVSSEEVDESQSDFVSRRDRLSSPLPTASKSMLNIRDGGVQLLPSSLDTERPQRRQRGGWGPPQQSPPENEWRQPSAAFVHSWATPASAAPQYATVDVVTTPLRRPLQPYQRGLTEGVSRRLSEAPSSVAIAQIQSISRVPPPATSAFRRESEQRVSLSKRHMNGQGPKAVWSPHAMTPKRTTAPTTPTGAAASAITRRPEDYKSSNLHLRSRSQSPNHMALSQLASRELTQQSNRRRDSDMSYTTVSSRLAPASSKSNLRDSEMRKSTDALNRMAALRKQMHQSTENLRKSTENLAVEGGENTMGSRARSISNLRGAQLEAAGSFDADRVPGSLAQSRMLARSMGNVSQADDVRTDDMPTNRLQNALSALRKASNPDLTQASLYEDGGGITLSADKTRRRGAVQKKVERYHPRNRTGRQQTSEESDSNTSDASFLNQSLGRRINTNGGIRSVSAVESPRSLQSRRIYEQQQARVNPQRRSNYLTQKLAGEDLPGPDLGSDDSPRSSVNASEWNSLLDDSSDCQQLVKHVQDCCDQHRVHTDRLLQARKMVEACSLTNDQKRIIMSQIDREMEKSAEKLNTGRRAPNDSNGNDYTPLKGVQALKQGFQNMHLK